MASYLTLINNLPVCCRHAVRSVGLEVCLVHAFVADYEAAEAVSMAKECSSAIDVKARQS